MNKHAQEDFRKASEKYGVNELSLLLMTKSELTKLGFAGDFAAQFADFSKLAASKIAPHNYPPSVQGKVVECRPPLLPPLWGETTDGSEKVYYNVSTLEFQKDRPGASLADIEKYSTPDLLKFLECVGFRSRLFGKDIFSVFRKERATGRGLLDRTYGDLVASGVPKDDAKRLRAVLTPIYTKASFGKFGVDDVCIWAESLGVSAERVGFLRKYGVTGKTITEVEDLPGFLRSIDVFEEDNAKIVEAFGAMD